MRTKIQSGIYVVCNEQHASVRVLWNNRVTYSQEFSNRPGMSAIDQAHEDALRIRPMYPRLKIMERPYSD